MQSGFQTKKDPEEIFEIFTEATDGFEPTIRELQSHALPLGYGALFLWSG